MNISATESIVQSGLQNYVPNYKQNPIVIDRGEGCRVWDLDGREYIDLGTGISVTSFGHRHPDIVSAFEQQASKLWHASNLYYTETPVRLAQRLCELSFAEAVFFCNSGSEANEAAIKLIRKHASKTRPPEKRVILTFEGSFHGRTLAAVTATAQPKYHEGFEPLPGGFRYLPFNDSAALREAFDDSVCGVIIEPVQGEGGIHVATEQFLSDIRALCDEHDAVMMCDEVQCGMGRTGKVWGHQWNDAVKPDVMTLAKALGNGLPIGALLAGPKVADTLQPGSHGSTFGGNPIACAVALAALRLASDPDLLDNVARQSASMHDRLTEIGTKYDVFKEVRGRGLMIGAELQQKYAGKAAEIGSVCQQNGVLVLSAGPDVVRLLPPLTIDEVTTMQAIDLIEQSIASWLKNAQG